jgi:D-alanyl-lipoteichoic acid acyltransferase DltB (MBOAT superfamily)
MLFNSFPFLFVFLPIAVIGFFSASAISTAAGRLWLAFMSLAFYTCWHPPFTVLLLASIVFNYGLGRILLAREGRAGQDLVLWFALACNVGALFYYKYAYVLAAALFTHGVTSTLWMDNVLLPLGISFFTFTQIGFLIDCRSGSVEDPDPLDYVLFVTFFPHLIAGPILHHREIMPQFARKSTYRLDLSNVGYGLVLFFIGLAKKVLIADQISGYASSGFADPAHLTLFSAWLCVLAYSLQLYFDFSGYSDMAIGIARMCNIQFPFNFNSPYKARNIIDFWQRWHMTLTRYLNLYLYNPIAMAVTRRRAARGLPVTRKATATPRAFASMVAMPVFVTMGLAGIWHGAGLQFLIFGLLAGYLVINNGWRVFGPKPDRVAWVRSGTWSVVCLLLTYLSAVVANVFFRATSSADAVTVLQAMVGWHGIDYTAAVPVWLPHRLGALGTWLLQHDLIGPVKPGQTQALIREILTLMFAYVIVFAAPNSQQIVGAVALGEKSTARNGNAAWLRLDGRWGVLAGFVALAAIMGIGAHSEFIYFQF